jgi:hypothetical protein
LYTSGRESEGRLHFGVRRFPPLSFLGRLQKNKECGGKATYFKMALASLFKCSAFGTDVGGASATANATGQDSDKGLE